MKDFDRTASGNDTEGHFTKKVVLGPECSSGLSPRSPYKPSAAEAIYRFWDAVRSVGAARLLLRVLARAVTTSCGQLLHDTRNSLEPAGVGLAGC